MARRRRAPAAALVAALALCVLPSAPAGARSSCPDDGDVGYVCAVNNPEDLIRVGGTPYVLTGNTGDTDSQGGGFYAVHARTREVRAVRPDLSGPAQPAYRGCPGPPDAARFSAHGIDLTGDRTVYAVNHGGRESIEVFRLGASGSGLTLRWIGCALTPEAAVGNSVAALPDGGFAMTVPLRGQDELLNAGLGRPTGAVLRWSPDAGWRELGDLALSFPNGLLVAPDGASLYVAGYTERTVARVALATGATLAKVGVPFNPDNLRWAPDGRILATGQKAEPAYVQATCIMTPVETCEVPTGVSSIDPRTLRATTLFERPGDARFGAGTSAVVVGDELWLGSFRAQRLLRVPRRLLAAPVGSEAQAPESAPSGAPRLRLVRRCVRGRLRAELRGDVDRVRAVSFKVGKRLVARDAVAPFRRVLPRRVLRRTRARQLRVVASLRDGRPVRVVLGRTLPRCGAR